MSAVPSPTLRPRWRFRLVNSKDMSNLGVLTEASGRKADILMDKPGAANFDYPMDGRFADVIDKYATGIVAERLNWRSTLAYNQAGNYGSVWDAIWSGYVLTINEDWVTNKMSVACVGWLQRLAKRLTRTAFTWNNVDDAQIISDLLAHANGGSNTVNFAHAAGVNTWQYAAPDSYTMTWPVGSSPNVPTWVQWGGTLPNEGVGGATAYAPVTRSLPNLAAYQYIMPTIDQMINLENGCDISLDPLTRQLYAHRRYERVLDNVLLGFQWGPENASQFSRTIDGEAEVNYFLAQGDATTTAGYNDSQARQLIVGPIDEIEQLGGVNNAATLLAYAGGEMIVRNNGIVTYGITPFAYTPNGSSPEPFVDYRPGDSIRVTAINPPRGNIQNQKVRVFGMSVTIDEEDNEVLGQLQIAP